MRQPLYVTPDLAKQLDSLVSSLLDSHGHEVPNPVPHSPPSGLLRPPTLQDQIKRLLRIEVSRQAQQQGRETFDEANDFDIGDMDDAPMSRYQMVDEVPADFQQRPDPKGGENDPPPVDPSPASDPDPEPSSE